MEMRNIAKIYGKKRSNMIQIKGLSKSYAKSNIKSVDSLSFNVKAGDIVGFIGPNGAGKSTTIKCLTGILSFEEGEIFICDKNIKSQPEEAKKLIAYVADENILYNALTGIQYINFISDIFNIDETTRKTQLERLANLFDMKDKLNDKIGTYSHGMKQKISIIAGLIHNPKVWILDEPMTGLDPKSCFELKKLMIEHANNGNAVLFSSHVLDVVEKLCTKVVILNKGKLLTECTMDELQTKKIDVSLEEFFIGITGEINA